MEQATHQQKIMFPLSFISMIEGEKNKVVISFLNQVDMKFDILIRNNPEKKESLLDAKRELRKLFLDSINGFSRLSKKILTDYIEQSNYFEKYAVQHDMK